MTIRNRWILRKLGYGPMVKAIDLAVIPTVIANAKRFVGLRAAR